MTDAEWEPVKARQLDRYYRHKENEPASTSRDQSAPSENGQQSERTTSKPAMKAAKRPPRKPPPP
jgi:hypothetical protein